MEFLWSSMSCWNLLCISFICCTYNIYNILIFKFNCILSHVLNDLVIKGDIRGHGKVTENTKYVSVSRNLTISPRQGAYCPLPKSVHSHILSSSQGFVNDRPEYLRERVSALGLFTRQDHVLELPRVHCERKRISFFAPKIFSGFPSSEVRKPLSDKIFMGEFMNICFVSPQWVLA